MIKLFTKEDEDREMPHDESAPYKKGETVYLKSLAGDDSLPTSLINKPFIITKCWRVPLSAGEPPTWDIDLIDASTKEECPFIILDEDLTRTKPF